MGRFLESAWFTAAYAACLGIAVIGVGCGVESAGERAGLRVEGTEPGDCEDGADNDADGLFDCDDSGCAASPLCDGGTGGTSGTGGGAGVGGSGGGGSMLCADVDCDDQNQCTEDACDPMDGACGYTNVMDGLSCDFGGLPGVCNAGVCEDAMLCAGIDCDDQSECTADTCNPTDGECAHTNVTDGTPCDFGGLPGICGAGVCEDAMLCAGVDCDDQNECTADTCDPARGVCDYTNVTAGMTCDFGGLPGVCASGACEDAMLCRTVDCDDGNECTEDVCDPLDGECDHTNMMDGTACDFGGFPGVCAGGACENAYEFEVIDLGPVGSSGTIRGVNNSGQIVGNSTISGSSRAFAIDGGTRVDLHAMFGATFGSDINDLGQVVGASNSGAFRHTLSSGTTTFIGSGWAFGINEAGSVVGTNGGAFVWRDTNADGIFQSVELIDLGVLPGEVSSRALAINDLDQIVGFSNDSGSFTSPVIWHNDTPSLLNLGTSNQATPEDINDNGLVVGSIGDYGVGYTPFLFEPVGGGTAELGDCCIARGINQYGAVVGGTAGGSFQGPAFLWTSDSGFRALDDLVDPALGWTLVRAWDINELGWIVGEGNLAGTRHGFLLIPY